MKFATLRDGSRDGQLLVVSRDLRMAASAADIVPTLQHALESWERYEPDLLALSCRLNAGDAPGAFALDPSRLMAPLPRAWQWLDGSSFLNHTALMQRAFGLQAIDGVEHVPLMYQGAGHDFLGPHEPVQLPSVEHGIDFEGEFAVVVDDVPMGCSAEQAGGHIRLILQLNDVSLRALAPREMKTGFGFIQAKASTCFAPVAVTIDELGTAWSNGRVALPLDVELNGKSFGSPNGREMHFGFHELVAHAALTRSLCAGTIIGSGTVSNSNHSEVGSACISERRAIEMIMSGHPSTSFLQFGDRVRMEACGLNGQAMFGAIDHLIMQSES